MKPIGMGSLRRLNNGPRFRQTESYGDYQWLDCSLVLVAASVAVVGSMIVLALFDLVLSRKRPSATTEVIDKDSETTTRSNLERAFSSWRRERDVTEKD
jgi:hypothetical protein